MRNQFSNPFGFEILTLYRSTTYDVTQFAMSSWFPSTRLVWLSLRNSARAIENTKPLTRWWRAGRAIRAKSYLMARHHHLSPDLLSDEQVQTYLLHLLQERQRSRSAVNITSCALRFLVCAVLGGAGSLALLQQVQQVRLHLLVAQQVRAEVVVPGHQVRDRKSVV